MSRTKKPVKPSASEVKVEIARLKEIKPKVRARSYFGDDNRASIEAQIRVMERSLDDDAIYRYYEPPNDEDSRSELDSALHARQWLDGESQDGKPSDSWESLIVA